VNCSWLAHPVLLRHRQDAQGGTGATEAVNAARAIASTSTRRRTARTLLELQCGRIGAGLAENGAFLRRPRRGVRDLHGQGAGLEQGIGELFGPARLELETERQPGHDLAPSSAKPG
jgi:hypothetical protein